MKLLDLPTEVVLSIADELSSSKDIFSWSLTNKAFLGVLLPAVYRFNARHEGSDILHWAACNSRLSLAQVLIEQSQADINAKDHKGQTPIILAIRHRNKDLLDLLLAQEKINLEVRSRRGRTPLLYAAFKGTSAIVETLIKIPSIETEASDGKSRTVLWYAVLHGMRTVVQQLCQAGDSINISDKKGLTPLNLAIAKKDAVMVDILLDCCSSVLHIPTHQAGNNTGPGQPSICLAAETGCCDIIHLLLKRGVDPNTRNERMESVLHLAAKRGHDSAVKILLGRTNIDPNARDDYNRTPLHDAAIQGHLSVMKLLLSEPDIDINARDNSGATALWWATEKRQYQVAKRLLAEDGVDVNVIGEGITFIQRTTPLHHGVQNEDESLVRLLLEEKSINPNIPDGGGKTPLAWAATMGSVIIVKLLLKHKHIHVNAPRKGEPTPLGLAAGAGHTEVVKELLAHSKLNPNETCEACFGDRPLLAAARKGHVDVVDLLVRDSRVEPHLADYDGKTALWWAADNGHAEVVKHLLKSFRVSVDMSLRRDPLSAAESKGHREVAQLLRAARCSTAPGIKGMAYPARAALPPQTPRAWCTLHPGHRSWKPTCCDTAIPYIHRSQVSPHTTKSRLSNTTDTSRPSGFPTQTRATQLAGPRAKAMIDSEFRRIGRIREIRLNHHIMAFLEDVHASLDAGRAGNPLGPFRRSLFHYAAMGDCTELVCLLLQIGAAVDCCDQNERTPLSWAAAYGALNVVKILVENGAKVNSTDDMFCTPLSWLLHAGVPSSMLARTEAYLRGMGAKEALSDVESGIIDRKLGCSDQAV